MPLLRIWLSLLLGLVLSLHHSLPDDYRGGSITSAFAYASLSREGGREWDGVTVDSDGEVLDAEVVEVGVKVEMGEANMKTSRAPVKSPSSPYPPVFPALAVRAVQSSPSASASASSSSSPSEQSCSAGSSSCKKNASSIQPVKFVQLKKTVRSVIPRNSTQKFCIDKVSGAFSYKSVLMDIFAYHQLHIVPLNSYQSFNWYSISLNSTDNLNNLFSFVFFDYHPIITTLDHFFYSCPSPLDLSGDRQLCDVNMSPLAEEACVSVSASLDSDISVIVLLTREFRPHTFGGIIFAFLGIFFASLLMEMRVLQYVFGAAVYILAGPPMIFANLLHSSFGGKPSFLKFASLLSSWMFYFGFVIWFALTILEGIILRNEDFSSLYMNKIVLYAVVMGNIGLLSVFWMRNKNDAAKVFTAHFYFVNRQVILVASYIVLFNSFASFSVSIAATGIVFALSMLTLK